MAGRYNLPIAHGTRHTYRYRRCRCEPCVKANADYQRQANRRRKLLLLTATLPHGTRNVYTNYMCRCTACKAAAAQDSRERRAKRRQRERHTASLGESDVRSA